MKSCTIFFKDTYLTASDPKSLFLIMSMLTYSEADMLIIHDDNDEEVCFRITKCVR